MKKFLVFMLTLALLGCGAWAETEDAAVLVPEAGETVEMDLDGDGEPETLVWSSVSLGEYDECVELTVTDGEQSSTYRSDMLYCVEVWLSDVDGDGHVEIFISGDEMSDDYYTTCLRYAGGAFEQLRFADCRRGENGDEPLEYGYGMVTAIDGNRVTLNGSQDVLGTYFFSRTMTLEGSCFAAADDGLWRIDRDLADDELWQSFAVLRPKQNLPAVFVDAEGAETEGEIAAGEGFVVTASDKTGVVWFAMEDGRQGHFAIAPAGDGWSLLVAGVPQDEMFDNLPFAD